MQINTQLKKQSLIYAAIVLLFLALSYIYMSPVLDGKVVNQGDIQGYMGMAHEMSEHNAAHPDDPTAWSNSMFGGMPTTIISAPRQGDLTQSLYDFLFTGRRPATYMFIALLGAFLLMLSLGVGKLLAVGGAIAIAFCSYNMQIINAGHNTKMQAIALLPWALAAFVYTYKAAQKDGSWKKWLPTTALGAVLFGFGLSLQVKANHQQITYYLALMLVIYAIAEFIRLMCDADRKRKAQRFLAASGLLLVLGLAGIGTNTNKLLPIYKYTPQSMRGGSELQAKGGEGESKGLDMDYATSWSYGTEELANMMIPNLNGGASSTELDYSKSQAAKVVADYFGEKTAQGMSKSLPLYWGPQPFTSGPMYIGAITIFLFLLGLLICEDKDRWWMLACTLLAILLGLGSNLQWFTTFFYKYAPFYNKFRTVSMALSVLQFTLPALGFLALDRVVKKQVPARTIKPCLIAAYAIAAGICLVAILLPDIVGSFTSASDGATVDSIFKAAFGSATAEYNEFKASFIDGLRLDRIGAMKADATRSLLLISTAAVLIWWATLSKKKDAKIGRWTVGQVCSAAICLFVLFDLYSADKRYLSSKDFVNDKDFKGVFKQSKADREILKDKDLSYRVLNLNNPFNDSRTSYWHKSIGGYSPAKLQRYQELIDSSIIPEIYSLYGGQLGEALSNWSVLNALNTRYIISDPNSDPIYNPFAYGNAWFVDQVAVGLTPDEDLEFVNKVDLRKIALLEDTRNIPDSVPAASDTIVLCSYAPNELHYVYSCENPRLTVFSEVFYPEGWHAWLADTGEEVEVFRADWILRAAVLPAGEHELVMRFDPKSYKDSAALSLASSIALIIFLILAVAGIFYTEKKEKKSIEQ